MAKEKITAYREKRKAMEWSIEAAAEELGMSDDTLRRIETEEKIPNPQEVLAMAKAFHAPELCNHYCHFDCEIGQKYVPEVEDSDLPSIVLRLLDTIYDVEDIEKTLVRITSDKDITDDEIESLVKVQYTLEQLSMMVEALQLCVEKKIDNNEISREIYEKAFKALESAGRK